MGKASSQRLGDYAVLTKSIEFVVRNLVRTLINHISLTSLVTMIERMFIEEAENFLREERPGRDVALTRLALLSGLDTRKLARIRNSNAFRKPLHADRDFLDRLTPEHTIIDLWTSNPRFCDQDSGLPRAIPIMGEEGSFEILVREAVRSRGVTLQSLLDRMKSNNQVRLVGKASVELTSKKFAPKAVRERISKMKLGLDAVGHLLGTVHHNVTVHEKGEGVPYFQRGSWTHRLDPADRVQVEEQIREHLMHADDQIREILKRFESDHVELDQLSAGVGSYYFETDTF